MNFDRKSLLLYAVTDRSFLGGRRLYDVVEQAIDGGVGMVQLREKNLLYDEFLKEAVSIKALCQKRKVPLIINDFADIALACKADGVHIGQSDLAARKVRRLIGDKMILGVSVTNIDQAIEAQRAGADYLGVGAVFPTNTKSDADRVSLEMLSKICQAVSIPVVAIGGITGENMGALAGSGIAGVALVSAIFANEEVRGACEILYTQAKGLFYNCRGDNVTARGQGEYLRL